MLLEEVLILLFIPLSLAFAGYFVRRAELTLIGGIGLLILGLLVLASPVITTFNLVNTTASQYEANCNVTDLFDDGGGNYTIQNQIVNCTREITLNEYAGTELETNQNLLLGLITMMTGLLMFLIAVVQFKD